MKKLFSSILLSAMFFIVLISVPGASALTNITSCNELQNISLNLTEDYQILNDIDCAGFDWMQIDYFNGSLDGNGFTIDNLTILGTTGNSTGIFGMTISTGDVVVENLNLHNFTIIAPSNAGFIVASFYSDYSLNLSNIHISDSYILGTDNVGGLVGTFFSSSGILYLNDCTVDNVVINCSAGNDNNDARCGGIVGASPGSPALIRNNSVSNSIVISRRLAGGIIGLTWEGNVNITDSFVDNVTVTCSNSTDGGSYCGGFTGQYWGNIDNCYAEDVTVSGTGYLVGGFAGSFSANDKPIEVKNSYSLKTNVICGRLYGCGGFVGQLYANVSVTNVSAIEPEISCSGDAKCGGFVGDIYFSEVNISESYVENPYMKCSESAYCGGFAGRILKGSVSDCHSESGIIYGNDSSAIGGFVAYVGGDWSGSVNDVLIEKSWTTTDIIAQGAGGFIGNGGIIGGTVNECYSSQNIILTSPNPQKDAGGFASWGNIFIINNSYTTTNISGSGQANGFMTLLGWGSNHQIYNSYAAGFVDVDSESPNGGCGFGCGTLTGHSENYWNSDTIEYNESKNDTTYSTSKTTAEMIEQSTYSGWDFENVWTMQEEVTYPYFQWQTENIPYPAPVTVTKPDLTFINGMWIGNENPVANEPTGIEVTVKNMENSASGESVVRFYDNDQLFATESVGSLNPGQSQAISQSFASADEGVHFIRAVVDPDGEISEWDEDNNELIRVVYVGEITDAGNMIMDGTLVPDKGYGGSSVLVYGTAVYNTTFGAGTKVKGGEVQINLLGQEWTANTNSEGYYSAYVQIPLDAPIGMNDVSVFVTDFTLNGQETLYFNVTNVTQESPPGEEKPDLTSFYSDIYTVPARLVEGSNVTLYVTVRNVGTADAYNVTVAISKDGDAFAEGMIPYVAKNGYDAFSFPLENLSSGGFTIKAVLDGENGIDEINENNNVRERYFFVYASDSIDLTVTGIWPSEYPFCDKNLTLYVKVYNDGEAAASDVTVRVWDGIENISDVEIGTMGSQEYKVIDVPWTEPSAGWHTIKAHVDFFNTNDETDEGNNVGIQQIYTYSPETDQLPDLRILSEDISFSDDDPMPGEAVTVYVDVTNLGDANASSFVVRISEDFTEYTVTIGEEVIDSLAIGEEKTVSVAYTTNLSGSHVILAEADPYGTIIDKNRNNNNATKAVVYQWPCTDEDDDGYGTGEHREGCAQPEEDCDDDDETVHPGASELCDGKDNDCDSVVPENETDSDDDGFMICEGDCNDEDDDVYPGAYDPWGDGIDQNCDGTVCGMKTDYDAYECAQSTVVVEDDEELADYLSDYGFNGEKYRNLKIAYDVAKDYIDIHTPCKMNIKDNAVFTGGTVCLDGRNGIIDDNGYTMNASQVALLSELDDVHFGQGSAVVADELYMEAPKTVKIGLNSDIDVSGPLTMISTGDYSASDSIIKQGSTVSAGSLYMEASMGVTLGISVTVDALGDVVVRSTGTAVGSEALMKQGSEVHAGSLDLSSTNKAKLGLSTLVNVTGNFNMEAVTPDKCTVSGSATIIAGSTSGNCLA